MNSPLPAPDSAPAPRRNWTRRLVNLLVALVVVAVAAATFVFSYSGVHAIALLGGMSTQLARYYPGLFDAVLVIACVAAVMLREGRWWAARLWAWLVIVVLLAAIAAADVLHAMNYSLRPRPTEGIVAAAPVAAVLLAFSLLLTLLRQSRSHPPQEFRRSRGGEQPAPATLEITSLPAAEVATLEIPALAASPQLRPPAPPIALPASFTPPPPVAEAAVTMPAPEADTVAGTVPGIAPGTATDAALTREEPVTTEAAPTRAEPAVATATEAEPPTVLTPAVADAPPVPEALAGPDTTAPAETETVPTAETAQQEAGPDAASETAAARPSEAAPPAEATSPSETPEPPTVPVPAPARTPAGIRYAGGAAPRTGRPDYWDTEEASPYAGQVYPARDEYADGEGNGHGGRDGGGNGTADNSTSDQPLPHRQPAELDDDAPPFATAPFAPVPRLKRVRSMPAPPADDED